MRMVSATAALCALGLASAAHAGSVAKDKLAIRASLEAGCQGFINGDVAAAMIPYSKDAFVFDLTPKLSSTYDDVWQGNVKLIQAIDAKTKPTCVYKDMVINVDHNHAYAHYLLAFTASLKGGKSLDVVERVTDIFERTPRGWFVVHEHGSVPLDIMSGKLFLHAVE